jgi:hypothetical protein
VFSLKSADLVFQRDHVSLMEDIRFRFTSSTLIKENDPIYFGVEVHCVGRCYTSTGSAMPLDQLKVSH